MDNYAKQTKGFKDEMIKYEKEQGIITVRHIQVKHIRIYLSEQSIELV